VALGVAVELRGAWMGGALAAPWTAALLLSLRGAHTRVPALAALAVHLSSHLMQRRAFAASGGFAALQAELKASQREVWSVEEELGAYDFLVDLLLQVL
ncbi:hypothetical protein T484DRAFT_1825210, partial [Baffinella frigidus]